MVTILNTGALAHIAAAPKPMFFCLGSKNDIDVSPQGDVMKNKQTFLKRIHDMDEDKDNVYDCLIFSTGDHTADAKDSINDIIKTGALTFADGTHLTFNELGQVLKKLNADADNFKIAIDGRPLALESVLNQTQYNRLQQLAGAAGFPLVANKTWKSMFVFKPNGTVTEDKTHYVESSIGSRSLGCGGIKSSETE